MKAKFVLCPLLVEGDMPAGRFPSGCWARIISFGLRPPLPEAFQAAAPARVALLSALREAREGQARQRTPVWCATTVHYYYEVPKRNKLNKKY